MSKMYHVPEHARDNYKGYHGMYPENYGNSEICRDEINEKLVSKAKKEYYYRQLSLDIRYCIMLIIKQDYRLGDIPKPYVADNEKDINMQIPDEIRKCVVFLGHSKVDKTEIVL